VTAEVGLPDTVKNKFPGQAWILNCEIVINVFLYTLKFFLLSLDPPPPPPPTPLPHPIDLYKILLSECEWLQICTSVPPRSRSSLNDDQREGYATVQLCISNPSFNIVLLNEPFIVALQNSNVDWLTIIFPGTEFNH